MWGEIIPPLFGFQCGGNTLQKLIKYINLGMKHFLNILMVVLTISVFLQVIFRFVIDNPLAWTEELARYCLVWLTFLGAAYAMSLKAHIGVEFFTNLFPPVGKKVIHVLASIVSIMFFILMIFQGLSLASNSMTQMSPVLQIPMGIVYLIIPISGFFLIINIIGITWSEIRKEDDHVNTSI